MVWNIPADTQVPQVEGGNFLSFFGDGRSPAWENFALHDSEGSYAKEENACCFSIPVSYCEYTHACDFLLLQRLNVSRSFGLSILENHSCWFNCGTRGKVWESPGSAGFILWAPWIFITNPAAVHPGDRFESRHKRTRISQVWKCIISSPFFKSHFYAWEHKQTMADEACGEQRGKQAGPQSSLNVSQGSFSLFQSLNSSAVCFFWDRSWWKKYDNFSLTKNFDNCRRS